MFPLVVLFADFQGVIRALISVSIRILLVSSVIMNISTMIVNVFILFFKVTFLNPIIIMFIFAIDF